MSTPHATSSTRSVGPGVYRVPRIFALGVTFASLSTGEAHGNKIGQNRREKSQTHEAAKATRWQRRKDSDGFEFSGPRWLHHKIAPLDTPLGTKNRAHCFQEWGRPRS